MDEHRTIAEQTMVVILAAGKGTRMGKTETAKACFEIDSVPAVNRTIATFKKRRFDKFLLVVGTRAASVLATVNAEHPEALYVYQSPELGTGDAAKIAAEALQSTGFDGYVLVTMGDKYVEQEAIEALVDGFVKQQADMALLTIPKTRATAGAEGRVFLDESGQALDIIEAPDLARQRIVDELKAKLSGGKSVSGSAIKRTIDKLLPIQAKQTPAVSKLLALAKDGKAAYKRKLAEILDSNEYNLEVGGKRYSARDLERTCKGINPSLYLFKAQAFYKGVALIDNNNAQGEYYLTDVVKRLAEIKNSRRQAQFRIRTVPADDANCIQGFNSPDELLAIQHYVRQRKLKQRKVSAKAGRPRLKRSQYCTVSQWIKKIDQDGVNLSRWLGRIYGKHEQLHREKRGDLLGVLKCYGRRFGYDEKVVIVRAPGRINLMGRHVDHRGGYNNFLAIDRETIAVAGLRRDNNVTAVNVEPKKFKTVKFNISELIGRFAWSDWVNFVNSDRVRQMLYRSAGDWGNYIKAAVLRLQHRYHDIQIKGLNLALSGNVPIAAGLSSSSTIVVAALQAAIALNNFELASQQFIDLCGEGEWFVGSRGGAGDHAAIYLGQRGKIAQVGYLPFSVEKIIEAPTDYQVMIANSHIKAAKSGQAKDTFNAKVASYNLALALLKQRCADKCQAVEYIRDINPDRLGCSTSEIYRMLLKLPESVTRSDFEKMLSKQYRDMMESNFATHSDPGDYNVRGVALFGISEIIRSAMCAGLLEAGEVEKFGELMKISHDGDRVSRKSGAGEYVPAKRSCGDDYLNGLIGDLGSEDPERVLAGQLYRQPGSYGCSTGQIDRMVDIACCVKGVAGAQIAGAGLGGCIMILAKKSSAESVRRALVRHYYRPNGLAAAVINCIMVEGAGLAEF